MARDPKASFKFTTIGSGAGGYTASADKLSGVYAVPATLTAGVAVISDVWCNFNETIGDAVRFGAQADVASAFAQPLITGGNGQNQLSFIKMVSKNTALAGTGLTDYKFQIVGDSQPVVTFTAASANCAGTYLAAFVLNTPVQFISSGVLPPEINSNTVYYVVTGATTSNFTVSATVSGTAITMSSVGTGVHQVVQVGVPAAATSLADRTLKNGVPLTPLVTCPFSANGACFKFVPLLTNNRSMQFQVTFPAISALGAGTISFNAVALQNGREGAMGVSF